MIRFIYCSGKTIKVQHTFFMFSRLNPCIFSETIITQNIYLIFLFFENNDLVLAKSDAKILSLNLA